MNQAPSCWVGESLMRPAFLLLFCFALLHPAASAQSNSSSEETIRSWFTHYPNQLKTSAILTILNMREGLTKQDWTRKMSSISADLRFHYEN